MTYDMITKHGSFSCILLWDGISNYLFDFKTSVLIIYSMPHHSTLTLINGNFQPKMSSTLYNIIDYENELLLIINF